MSGLVFRRAAGGRFAVLPHDGDAGFDRDVGFWLDGDVGFDVQDAAAPPLRDGDVEFVDCSFGDAAVAVPGGWRGFGRVARGRRPRRFDRFGGASAADLRAHASAPRGALHELDGLALAAACRLTPGALTVGGGAAMSAGAVAPFLWFRGQPCPLRGVASLLGRRDLEYAATSEFAALVCNAAQALRRMPPAARSLRPIGGGVGPGGEDVWFSVGPV